MVSLRQFAKYLLVLAGLLVLPVLSQAGDLGPTVPKAKANASDENKCVAPVEDMRKNHMDHMLHKRDETLREGVRTKQFSLVECIDCHVTPDKSGKYARFGEDGHFCSSCHNYAAVNVDCFDCHSDLPQNASAHMHSLNKPNPHHKELVLNGALTKETLDVLTSGGTK